MIARVFVLLAFLFAGYVRAATLVVTSGDYVDERWGPYVLEVALVDGDGAASVGYRVVGSTATAGEDFVASTGRIEIPAGATGGSARIEILNDSATEGQEEFVIEFFDPVGAEFGAQRMVIRLFDNDSGYWLNSGSTPEESVPFVEMLVERAGDYDFASSATVTITPENAVPGVDYVAETFTINFALGQTRATFRVRLLNDTVEDGDKALNLTLTTEGNIPIAQSSARIEVRDNERGYGIYTGPFNVLGMRQGGLEVFEGSAEVVVERRGDYDVASTAVLRLRGVEFMSATEGADFATSDVRVEFAPGQTQARAVLPIINDRVHELIESVGIEHTTSVNNAAFARHVVRILDDDYSLADVTPICLPDSQAAIGGIVQTERGLLVQTVRDERRALIRFKEDFELDASFAPIRNIVSFTAGAAGDVWAAVYDDERNHTIRHFLADGSPDPMFQPVAAFPYALASAPEGKLYALLSEESGLRLVRYNRDGSRDLAFPEIVAEGRIEAIFSSAEGLYVAGWFTAINGVARSQQARLTHAGVVDETFNPPANVGIFLASGEYIFGTMEGRIVRLKLNGSIDESFPAFNADSGVLAPDGSLYNIEDGQIVHYLSDGSVDATFGRVTVAYPYLYNWDARAIFGGELVIVPRYVPAINGAYIDCGEVAAPIQSALGRMKLVAEAGALHVDPHSSVVIEENGLQQIGIIRNGPTDAAATRRYRIGQTEGVLTFAAGVSRAEIPFTPVDDNVVEGRRPIQIEFVNEGGGIVSRAEASLFSRDIRLDIKALGDGYLFISPYSNVPRPVTILYSEDLETWNVGATRADGWYYRPFPPPYPQKVFWQVREP